MKKIGLIGGLSWESTLPYYKIINETIAEKGGIILQTAYCTVLIFMKLNLLF